MSVELTQTPFSAKFSNLPPRKPKNSERRSREYLTHAEVDRLRKAARGVGRHGHRDDSLTLGLTVAKKSKQCGIIAILNYQQDLRNTSVFSKFLQL